MNDRVDPRMVRYLSAFAVAASLLSAGVGCSALWGWWFHVEVLKNWWPGQPSLRFNAALCYVLLGVALWLLRKNEERDRRPQMLGKIAAVIVALVGLITLTENLAGVGKPDPFFPHAHGHGRVTKTGGTGHRTGAVGRLAAQLLLSLQAGGTGPALVCQQSAKWIFAAVTVMWQLPRLHRH